MELILKYAWCVWLGGAPVILWGDKAGFTSWRWWLFSMVLITLVYVRFDYIAS